MTHETPALARRQTFVAGTNAVVAALVFAVDFQFPLGINVPLLYIVPVVLTLWQSRWHDTLIAAGGCTALTFLRLVWSPWDDWPAGLANRVLTALGIWLTAFLVMRFKRASQAIGRLAAIVESSDDAIIGETPDGVIASWNRGAERMFGYTAAEAVGRPATFLVPPDRVTELASVRTRLTRGDRVDHFDTLRLRKDGQPITVSLSVSPVQDEGGRVVGASTVARDVTERIRAERAVTLREARIHSILETAADGVLVIDSHGVIQLANPAIERLFGYAAEELLGRNVSLLMPSPHREQHDGYLARYLATGNAHILGLGREVVGLHKDGHTVPLAISVSEMNLEGERAFTGVMRDLTEQKRTEARLYEQADLARLGQMAAVVAHEVRNALAGIRAVLQVVGARLPEASPDQPIRAEMIKRVQTLEQFVTDLLTLSRPARPVFTRCTLVSVLQRVTVLLTSDPRFEKIAVEIQGADPILEMDQRLVEPALLNLLLNAAQAMNGAGTITIAIEVVGAVCRLAIRDTGAGIPRDVKDRIFEPFFTTKHRGTGLGLTIAKQAIQQHGGTVDVQSTPGAGTTVTVTVPLRPPAAGSAAGIDPTRADAR